MKYRILISGLVIVRKVLTFGIFQYNYKHFQFVLFLRLANINYNINLNYSINNWC
jgi:hypothetical protein